MNTSPHPFATGLRRALPVLLVFSSIFVVAQIWLSMPLWERFVIILAVHLAAGVLAFIGHVAIGAWEASLRNVPKYRAELFSLLWGLISMGSLVAARHAVFVDPLWPLEITLAVMPTLWGLGLAIASARGEDRSPKIGAGLLSGLVGGAGLVGAIELSGVGVAVGAGAGLLMGWLYIRIWNDHEPSEEISDA